MSQSRREFLNHEYQSVWKEYGLEGEIPHSSPKKLPRVAPSKALPPSPVAATTGKFRSLEDIQTWIGDCRRCGLCAQRSNIVFGSGNPNATLMFVGEGPGADEDAQGVPFVGKAGQLLTKIIEAMGFQRPDVYIANVVKCRPPENRVPEETEVAECIPFLKAQINLIKPKFIVTLGATASSSLLQSPAAMTALRSKFHKLPWNPDIEVMPTYHPAYLLRNPPAKKLVWDDMKLVMAKLK